MTPPIFYPEIDVFVNYVKIFGTRGCNGKEKLPQILCNVFYVFDARNQLQPW